MSNLKRKLLTKAPLAYDLLCFLTGKRTPIFIDYKPDPISKSDQPNAHLYKIIDRNREQYKQVLQQFLPHIDNFAKIPVIDTDDECQPVWFNGFLPGLDSVSLYGILAINNPKLYIEVGSGNSTKFARRAINDNQLQTRIISIDPFPRASIDSICDEVIRKPVEDIELTIFDNLQSGDILFIDNSHRCFPNSDVTISFLDILPRLKKGVLVHFHDIYLPYEYSMIPARQWYSEQYLLACYLLAEGSSIEVILPNMFISRDKELQNILLPLWERPEMKGTEEHGVSFWIRKL